MTTSNPDRRRKEFGMELQRNTQKQAYEQKEKRNKKRERTWRRSSEDDAFFSFTHQDLLYSSDQKVRRASAGIEAFIRNEVV